MPTVPSLLGLLLCDQVLIDQRTDKKTLVGLIDIVTTPKLPALREMGFYARLTDLEGSYDFSIRVVQLTDEERLIAEAQTPPTVVKDRLDIVEIVINLPLLALPDYGRYEFQLLASGVYLGRALLKVVAA